MRRAFSPAAWDGELKVADYTELSPYFGAKAVGRLTSTELRLICNLGLDTRIFNERSELSQSPDADNEVE